MDQMNQPEPPETPETPAEPESFGAPEPPPPVKKPNPAVSVLLCAVCVLLGGAVPTGLFRYRSLANGIFVPTAEEFLPTVVSGAAFALCLILFAASVRKPRPLVIPAVAFFLALSYVGPFCAVAGLSVLLTAALSAHLVEARKMPLVLLLPVAACSYLLSLFLTRDPALALFALLPYPPAAFLTHADSDEAYRAETIARVTAGLFLGAGLSVAGAVLIRNGHIDLSAIRDAIDDFGLGVRAALVKYGMGQIDEKTAAAFSDNLINLLPGLILIGFEICGSLIRLIGEGLRYGDRYRRGVHFPFRSRRDEFRMSPVSGAVFLLCFLLSLFGSDSVFFTVLDNLSLVLTLPMFVVGVKYLISVYRSPRSRMRVFPIALAVLAVFLYGFGAIPLLAEAVAILGASESLFRPIREKLNSLSKE